MLCTKRNPLQSQFDFQALLINRLCESAPHFAIDLKASAHNRIAFCFVNDIHCPPFVYFVYFVYFVVSDVSWRSFRIATKYTKHTKREMTASIFKTSKIPKDSQRFRVYAVDRTAAS